MNQKDAKKLKVGDSIEAGHLFQSIELTQQVLLTVSEVNGDSVKFKATYLGVNLGEVTYTKGEWEGLGHHNE